MYVEIYIEHTNTYIDGAIEVADSPPASHFSAVTTLFQLCSFSVCGIVCVCSVCLCTSYMYTLHYISVHTIYMYTQCVCTLHICTHSVCVHYIYVHTECTQYLPKIVLRSLGEGALLRQPFLVRRALQLYLSALLLHCRLERGRATETRERQGERQRERERGRETEGERQRDGDRETARKRQMAMGT